MKDAELLDWFRDHLFREFGVRKECVTTEADFEVDLGADSLDYTKLIMEVEDQFDINIADTDVEGIRTVGDAIQYLLARLPDGNSRQ